MIEPGQLISHYKILEKLGEGGMGLVYKAEDTLLKRTVALKFLPPAWTAEPDARLRFIREAQAASALDHPNICTVHDVGQTDDGQTYIVMAVYEGETIEKKIEGGRLKIEDGINIAIQVTEGLARAHEAGIVHRDIKPANIFLTTRGEVKILDFGLARVAGQSMLTKSGTTLGTAAYMSPEQARSETVDHRTDLWSLGVVLYQMLTGTLPFKSEFDEAILYSIINENPKPVRQIRPEVPEVVEQIVLKALAKKPEQRYQSAADLLSDLRSARGIEQTSGTIAAAEAVQRKKRRRLIKRTAISIAAVSVILLGLFVIWPLVHEQLLAANPRTIAVISFENQTGDKSQDHIQNILQDAIITSLEESKYIRVTTRQRMADIMKQMGKKDVEYVDNEMGLEICRREGAQLMAVGTFASVGELYKTTLKLVDVNTLETVETYTTSGKGVESLLEKQLDDLSREVSRGVGVSQRKTEQTIRPVAEISTTSMEAYQLYLRGVQENEKLSWVEARRFLEMSVQKDSLFAMAWFNLGGAYSWLGDTKAADEAFKKAASLAWRASDKEKYLIAAQDSSLRTTLLGLPGLTDLQFARLCVERFPREKEFYNHLGTVLYIHEFKPAEAIPVFKKGLELDPGYAPMLSQLGNAYAAVRDWGNALETFKRYAIASPGDPNPYDDMGNMYAGRQMYDEAAACYRQALAVNSSWCISAGALAGLEFNRENYESAQKWSDTAAARGKEIGNQAGPLYGRAFDAFWLGRLNEAERLLARREAILKKAGQPVDHAVDFLHMWIACERRQFARSRRALNSWGTQFQEEEAPEYRRIQVLCAEMCGGFIEISAGRMDSAAAHLARMDSIRAQISPSDTTRVARRIVRYYQWYSGALRSEWLLGTGRSHEALAARRWRGPTEAASRPYNLFNPGFQHTLDGPIPVMVDVVPRAYLALGQLDSAITGYERAVSYEADPSRPIFPRYHYRLAQVYEQKGLRTQAIAEYEKFLKIWGKADPIYREPADARARLAKLKRG